jgi:hypothetical protein
LSSVRRGLFVVGSPRLVVALALAVVALAVGLAVYRRLRRR